MASALSAQRSTRGLALGVLGALVAACSDTQGGADHHADASSSASGGTAEGGAARPGAGTTADGSMGVVGGTAAGAGRDASASGDASAADAAGAPGASRGDSGPGTPGGASGGADASAGTRGDGGSADASGTDGSSGPGAGDLCDVGVWDGSKPEVLALSGNTFAHDPSVVEADGVFYRFWTGDFIPQATSTDLRRWQNAPTVYDRDYPSWADTWLAGISNQTFNFPWAPDVSFFHGQYHLYSSFSAIFGRNVSCITHLTTSNIAAGDWTDHGPVICTRGSERYNAIDADVALDTDGTPWLAFGSFWDGIMAFRLNPDGSRAGTDMTRLAWAEQIEGPVLFRRCGYYYLFVSWGLCCPGEGRSVDQLSYRVAVGRSRNIMGPYVDRAGKSMVEGGGTVILQGDGAEWAAAGHGDVIATGDKIYHVYHAYRRSNAAAQFRIVELPFDDQGWPVPGGP